MSFFRRCLVGLVGLVLSTMGLGLAFANPSPVLRAEYTDFPVRIELPHRQALDSLLATVPLAGFSREQIRYDRQTGAVVFTPRISEGEASRLAAAGFDFRRLPDLDQAGRRAVEKMWLEQADKSSTEWTTYPTYEQIGTTLADLETAYPALCRTFTWGQSVQGRELWGLVVSVDPDQDGVEPEVRLSSSMHGDEPTGMVMLMNLAEDLLVNYGQPGHEDVTYLVDNYEIHIMPLHNPDGYVAGTRANASGVDLNRDFPEPTGTAAIELENINFMAYADAHHFVISQNGHSGALVVNYPWDYTFELTPDDAAIQLLSLEYSTYNLPMYDGYFTDGITNGAEWYITNGGVQDWSYFATGCIDLTVELSNIKWPNANQLAGFWDDNRESLLHFIKAARYGINGVVTDEDTGLPLAATVTVANNAKPVATDPAGGDYYKLLPTGTYDLAFTADGYVPRTMTAVGTTWGTPTVLDVALVPEASSVPAARTLSLRARPNPFNPLTLLEFSVPHDGPVSLVIWDVQGRRVRDLLDGQVSAGDHAVSWDGGDARGRRVSSGTYFARLQTAAGVSSAKLLLVK